MTSFRVCPRPSCSELNDIDALYCSTCATPLVPNISEQTRPRCPWCGVRIKQGAATCREHMHIPDPYKLPA